MGLKRYLVQFNWFFWRDSLYRFMEEELFSSGRIEEKDRI